MKKTIIFMLSLVLVFGILQMNGCVFDKTEQAVTSIGTIRGKITQEGLVVGSNKPGIRGAFIYVLPVSTSLANLKPDKSFPYGVTDAAGFFVIFGIPSGTYILVIDSNNDNIADDRVFNVEVIQGNELQVEDIVINGVSERESWFRIQTDKISYNQGDTVTFTFNGINNSNAVLKLGYEIFLADGSNYADKYSSFSAGKWIEVQAGEEITGKKLTAEVNEDWLPSDSGVSYLGRSTFESGEYAGDQTRFDVIKEQGLRVKLLSPVGNEKLTGVHSIIWQATSSDSNIPITGIDIDFSKDGGNSWEKLIIGSTNTGNYTWNTTELYMSSNCLIKVTATDGQKTATTQSDSSFTVGFWKKLDISGSTPTPRNGHSMVYDSDRDRVILFGGQAGNNGQKFNDLWEWDGITWTEKTPAGTKPSARSGHAMGFLADNGTVVVFGGSDGGNKADTWIWDGNTWDEVNYGAGVEGTDYPANIGKYGTELVYDPKRKRLVLFSGRGSNSSNKTWEWDGMQWNDVSPGGTMGVDYPVSRSGHSMTYYPEIGKVLLYGGMLFDNSSGNNWDCNRAAYLWSWDGTSWNEISRKELTGQNHAEMVYHPGRKTILFFGGKKSSTYSDETWEWNGTTWSRIDCRGPFARSWASMTRNPGSDDIFLFGGGGGTQYGDSWTFGQ
ncbi:hypothetical protein KAJ27_07575 [bacterium]|nr:hypothetical protein [bacterium]